MNILSLHWTRLSVKKYTNCWMNSHLLFLQVHMTLDVQTSYIKHQTHTGEAPPIQQPVRRLPLAKREETERSVQEMRELDVIEPSASPWSSPIILVNKKDGSTRFCVDYRKLNNVTHKDSYPLPCIDDTIEVLSGAKFFSQEWLLAVPLEDSAKEKTAFSTESGLWQFKVMLFGLCNAPATFERLMEQVLFGLPMSVALVYLDDIIVPGHSFSQQIANLYQVFERLRKAKLKLSPVKCILFQRRVKYCVTRRELLAVVKAIKHFHAYLYGRTFLIRTDHSALRWLLNFRHPEGQIARWIESLQQYNFTIEH